MHLRVLFLAGWLGGAVGQAEPPVPRTWETIPVGRSAALAVPLALPLPAAGRVGFAELSPVACGIAFTNRLAEARSLTNQILLNGSGVAAGDVDGDGWCDLYFCGLDGPNALYRNLGAWRFEDIAAPAGVACADQASTGAALADVDGDGDLDLLVNGLGRGTRLFLNDGRARFREATAEAGLRGRTGAHSLALADIDNDGDLDLYVVNYRPSTFRDEANKRYRVSTADNRFDLLAVDGRPVTEPDLIGRFTADREQGVLEHGEADVLYRNDGAGHFTAVSWTDGAFLDEEGRPVAVPYDWGLSAQFHDLDGDGDPDLYVCNDFQSPDRVWLNEGQGRFRALPRLALRQTSIFSMGVDVADVDRDGHMDVFVADMFSREHAKRQVQLMDRRPVRHPAGALDDRPQYSRNTLLRNWGDATFAEVAQLSGLEASDWTWCPVFLDVDLDGYEDLLTVNGHVRDAQNIDIARQIDAFTRQHKPPWPESLFLRRLFQPLHTSNFAFRNRGDLTFEEVGARWGFASLKVSQGVALADLDQDGDLDVVVNCLNDGPLLCRNETTRPRVAVRLRGTRGNTAGIGAQLTVRAPGLPLQSQEILSGGRYLSSDEPLRTFAAGDTGGALTLTVRWRSGATSVFASAAPNRLYEFDEPAHAASDRSEPPHPVATPEVQSALFEDVSARLGHGHRDASFDDFERQPLLPHGLSRLGPGVSWFDVDGDGWDDLIVAGGRGGALGVLRNDRRGGFVPDRDPPFDQALVRDQIGVLGWHPAPGRRELLAASANYVDGATNGVAVLAYDLGSRTMAPGLPAQIASPGPLALADVDADGDLDLFVGGRVIAGRYPQAASSGLFRNADGRLAFDEANAAVLAEVGLVSGAVFTDLDGDGWPDLALACEGGPVRLFRNARGRFEAWVPWVFDEDATPVPLSEGTGWWTSVAAGDFDGDGRMDLIAGNWGRNTKYQSHLGRPIEWYSGDLDGDGRWEVVEGYTARESDRVVPLRDWETLASALPWLRERYHSFTEFSTATLADILGDRRPQMQHDAIRTLTSVLLLNRGDRFARRALPLEAQFAPVFGLAVADFDGDGHEDVCLVQNCFDVAPLTSRHDAGLGLWLRGDGRGGLAAVSPLASGLRVYGEGRGAAAGDFDQDGRVDLAVGQHAQATRLFRNVGAKPGLRVRLLGPPGNPTAVGAVLRVRGPDGSRSAAREIHAGSGYASQDASVSVLARSSEPSVLEIRWLGGACTESAVPAGAGGLEVRGP